jgi:hypothetical protein
LTSKNVLNFFEQRRLQHAKETHQTDVLGDKYVPENRFIYLMRSLKMNMISIYLAFCWCQDVESKQ